MKRSSAGLTACLFGKWHLGSNLPYRPMDRGFDEWLGQGDGGTGTTGDPFLNDRVNDHYLHTAKAEAPERSLVVKPAGEDGFSVLPLMKGEDKPVRSPCGELLICSPDLPAPPRTCFCRMKSNSIPSILITLGITFVVISRPAAAATGTDETLPTAQPATRPNIILIMADDLGYGSLGCYGSREIKTPNIDHLAATGIRFTDFHSNGAMCSPTRAALMTGRYQQRCAWVADEELSPVFREQRKKNLPQRWAWGISANELTIAEVLQQTGYHTGIIGKWHLGYDAKFHPMTQGFDEFRGFVGGNVDYHTHIAGYGLKQLDWWHGRQIENDAGYTTDLLTKYAADFITRNKDKPFFLYLAHAAPHEPWQGRDPGGKKFPADTYKEMIGILDESVGAITETLRENQLEKSTLLIFCSDNGAAPPPDISANGHLQGRKGSMLEGGHRVPFIASWPGVVPPGTTQGETVMSMDLFPTFAGLAGANPPQGHPLDGADIMPLLKGGTQAHDRVLYWQFGDSWAVRKGPWKLIGKGQHALTLVNLTTDIEEKINLLKEQPVRVDELIRLHRQWAESVGNR